MLKRSSASVAITLGILGSGANLNHGAAQPTAFDLEAALLERLAVWTRPDGGRIYIAHCRRAPRGCEDRVRRYAHAFVDAGAEHGVDPWLLAAIAMHESGLSPGAVGSRGERGIMQLHPGARWGLEAARACRRDRERCTEASVGIAAALLRRAIDRCGGEAAALGMYNSGRCRVTGYSERVLRRRDALRRARGQG